MKHAKEGRWNTTKVITCRSDCLDPAPEHWSIMYCHSWLFAFDHVKLGVETNSNYLFLINVILSTKRSNCHTTVKAFLYARARNRSKPDLEGWNTTSAQMYTTQVDFQGPLWVIVRCGHDKSWSVAYASHSVRCSDGSERILYQSTKAQAKLAKC